MSSYADAGDVILGFSDSDKFSTKLQYDKTHYLSELRISPHNFKIDIAAKTFDLGTGKSCQFLAGQIPLRMELIADWKERDCRCNLVSDDMPLCSE